MDKCQLENDGVLFTGIAVLEAIRAEKKIIKPYETLPKDGISLISTLMQLQKDGVKHSRISVDVVQENVIKEIIEEFGLQFDEIYTMPFDVKYEENAYSRWHSDLYNNGSVDVLLTSFGYVYETLRSKGLPSYRLYVNNTQIRQSLERLINRIESNDFLSTGIAMQLIQIKGGVDASLCSYDDLQKTGKLYLEFLEYVREIQGSISIVGREDMVIFSTRGAIEKPHSRNILRKLLRWSNETKILFYSGIGYGKTAYEAEKAARKALKNAKSCSMSAVFVVDDGVISGPIGEKEELDYYIRVDDEKLLAVSEATNISASYLTRIKALMEKNKRDTFDAKDLASALSVTERSAQRILKKLIDSGNGVYVAKENYNKRGRPKNIVKICL